LIETYDLPYSRVAEDRYQLVGARSQAGMGPIPGTVGLVYSHHVNDPAYGQTCSAFDLVRLHRFGHLDEERAPRTPVNKLPSQAAMLELATADSRTIAQMVGMDMDDAAFQAEEWKLRLRRGPRSGKILDHIKNWDLIGENDPAFRVLCYNELTLSPEADADLPWREVTTHSRIITSSDRWEFAHHIEREYDFRPSRDYVSSKVDAQALQRHVNPVRAYLEQLVWDGKRRVEECLPGVAKTTDYTRLVARKVMVAAVARMLDPGCKWDHTLVLYGPEGIGKSWWIERIARGYASTLGRIDNKDTLLVMQRSWIVMADESHSLSKADQEAQKEFLTRTHDVYRMPYERETLVHPRHCVIWSTTNDETFLRRQEGNRRFLTVHCSERVNFDAMTDTYVDQIWAEAVYMYRAGEPLYLDETQSSVAVEEREWFVEEDTLAGVVQEYLGQLVPSDWWDRTLESRQRWLADRDPNFDPPGTMPIDRVCSTQIWVEALGRRKGDIRRTDLLEITKVLKRLKGWTALEGRNRMPGYGPQLVFVREESP
jgi:putative DNA primase/helicase